MMENILFGFYISNDDLISYLVSDSSFVGEKHHPRDNNFLQVYQINSSIVIRRNNVEG